ncbi:MAG: phosphatase PAP2 family protein [Bacteroidota bacterium]
MLRTSASFISWITHPLLAITYIYILLLLINPFDFGFTKWSDPGAVILFIRIFLTTFFIPAFAVLMLTFIGLAKSIELPEKEDRIAPYIISGIFYLWMFRNLLDNPDIPPSFSRAILGASIGLFLAFFINIFDKISAHTVGIGGILGFILVFLFQHKEAELLFQGRNDAIYLIPLPLIFLFFILLAGLVGSSRLYLKAHQPMQVYGGFIIGIIAQFIALRFVP